MTQQRLPDDVLLRVAHYSTVFSNMDPSVDGFRSLAGVCPIFLHVGLTQRYRSLRLHATQGGVKLMRHVRSSPLIVPIVQTLDLDLYDSRFRRVNEPALDQVLFADELCETCMAFSRIREININWGELYRPSGWGYPAPYVPRPTVGLHAYGNVLLHILEGLSPTLQVLRAKIYVDAIPLLASLRNDLLKELEVFELRVYGGVWPEGIDKDDMNACLAAIATSVVLPSACTLGTLDVCFAPMNGRRHPMFTSRHFFEKIARTHLPSLTTFEVEAQFLEYERHHVGEIIRSGVHSGRLTSLALQPSSYQGYDGGLVDTQGYTRLLLEDGKKWTSLQSLSISVPPQWPQRSNDGSLSNEGLGSGLLAIHRALVYTTKLEVLILTGHFFNGADLRALLQQIQAPLRQLSVNIQVLQPSTIHDLAAFASSVELLHLTIGRTSPDGVVSASAISEIKAELAISDPDGTTSGARSRYLPKNTTRPLTLQDLLGAVAPIEVGEEASHLARERLFLAELQAHCFDGWALRKASIVHPWSPGCVINTPPPRDAFIAAMTLQQVVPGLTFTEVRPLNRLYYPRINELRIERNH